MCGDACKHADANIEQSRWTDRILLARQFVWSSIIPFGGHDASSSVAFKPARRSFAIEASKSEARDSEKKVKRRFHRGVKLTQRIRETSKPAAETKRKIYTALES